MGDAVRMGETLLSDIDHGAVIKEVSSWCVTEGGRAAVEEILTRPTTAAGLLVERAADLRRTGGVIDALAGDLRGVAGSEAGAAWCCLSPESLDEDTLEAVSKPYFGGLAGVANRHWPALWASSAYTVFAAPAIAILSPLAYVIVPFMVVRLRFGIPIGFWRFVLLLYHSFRGAGAAMDIALGSTSQTMQLASLATTIVVYAQSVYSSVGNAISTHSACCRITSGVNSLSDFLGATYSDRWPWSDDGFFSRWMPECCVSGRSRGPVSGAVRPWATGFAVALAEYRSMDREWAADRMRRVFCVDAVCAIANASVRHRMTPVVFSGGGATILAVRGGRRLHAPEHRRNSFVLTSGVNGAVVTGANASGKSTVLRMLGGAVLLAQTTGMVPAEACLMRPLAYVCSMMGVRDDPATGRSRFQNELLRTGECLEAARSDPLAPGLLLMDEIFSGTDAEQGDVCGSKVLSTLSRTPGCLFALCTHQAGLVSHSETIPSTRRYRMVDGFGVSRGVSRSGNAVSMFSSYAAGGYI